MREVSYEYRVCLEAEKVRELCVEHNFYTRGNSKSYEDMLNKCKDVSTPDSLMEIAQDIVDHSDVENNEDLASYEPLDEVVSYLEQLCKVRIATVFTGYHSNMHQCTNAKRTRN